jgi:hypothetical protein
MDIQNKVTDQAAVFDIILKEYATLGMFIRRHNTYHKRQ